MFITEEQAEKLVPRLLTGALFGLAAWVFWAVTQTVGALLAR